jgi:hypothetical protein
MKIANKKDETKSDSAKSFENLAPITWGIVFKWISSFSASRISKGMVKARKKGNKNKNVYMDSKEN